MFTGGALPRFTDALAAAAEGHHDQTDEAGQHPADGQNRQDFHASATGNGLKK